MPGIDGGLIGASQRLYDFVWDLIGMPVGAFRMAVALLPVTIDTGLEFAQGRGGQCSAGLLLYLVAICFLYSPGRMVREDRMQEAGHLATLNAEARAWERRTTRLRSVYLLLTAFSMLAFHHLGGLALVDVAFARCLQVRPRMPRDRVGAKARGGVAGLRQTA